MEACKSQMPNLFSQQFAQSANTYNYIPTRLGTFGAIFVLPLTYFRKIFKVKVLFGYSAPLTQCISKIARDWSPVSRFNIVVCSKARRRVTCHTGSMAVGGWGAVWLPGGRQRLEHLLNLCMMGRISPAVRIYAQMCPDHLIEIVC